MKRVILLTGSELRHEYVLARLSADKRFKLVKAFQEGVQLSLISRVEANPLASKLEYTHAKIREQREHDFFADLVDGNDTSGFAVRIAKGEINRKPIRCDISSLEPDLLVAYGSSLIGEELISEYRGRFLNVHLGLSPYYRGSGTNIWPLILQEPQMVGATFMHIDSGIDSGEVIHQIRADIHVGDGPHEIGNRLIRKMAGNLADLIARFDTLEPAAQITEVGRVFKRADFDSRACSILYENFRNGMIEDYLANSDPQAWKRIVENPALRLP
jgi:phosphoribosylglycinamide formyltransferase 1